ncbi:Uncharacterised protein [Mycobacteroides abscessus]|nr:Uncharacterised protein [Mycobacteroides abscessus]
MLTIPSAGERTGAAGRDEHPVTERVRSRADAAVLDSVRLVVTTAVPRVGEEERDDDPRNAKDRGQSAPNLAPHSVGRARSTSFHVKR